MTRPSTRSRGDDSSSSSSSSSSSPSPFPSSSSCSASSGSPLDASLGLGTLYPGLLPVIPDGSPLPEQTPSSNAATGASAAGVRALTSQAVAFYFRAPVKAFFRTRVDYLAYARALQELQQQQQQQRATFPLPSTSTAPTTTPSPTNRPTTTTTTTTHWLLARLRATTPGLLTTAIRHHGWRVVPDQVLPPLLANAAVGAVLYTAYLQALAQLHPASARPHNRVYPPPAPLETFAAGFLAGGVQSVVAAPLDAVQARWEAVHVGGVGVGAGGGGGRGGSAVPGMTGSGGRRVGGDAGLGTGEGRVRTRSMWAFSAAKLREIGARGMFAGWGLSFLKDSMGSAVFFSVFEYLKAQGYYGFVTWYYGSLSEDAIVLLSQKRPAPEDGRQREAAEPRMPAVIRPHYAIEPAFLLLAGMGASVAQQLVLHPLSHVQAEHWERLESLDAEASRLTQQARSAEAPSASTWRWRMLRAYRDAYRITWLECVAEAQTAGLSMRRWLYRGFWWNTIRQVPSTSAGLIIFELVRRKYGFGGDQVRINRDGYDIMLN